MLVTYQETLFKTEDRASVSVVASSTRSPRIVRPTESKKIVILFVVSLISLIYYISFVFCASKNLIDPLPFLYRGYG